MVPAFAKYERNFFESSRTPIFAPTSDADASLNPKSAKPFEKSPLWIMFGAAQAAQAKSEQATIDLMFLPMVVQFLELVDLQAVSADMTAVRRIGLTDFRKMRKNI